MSQYTKEHIVTKTIELAEKKPLTKITVKEIAQESGVTRNAFYYYFHDIFDVFTYYIDSHIQELIDRPYGGNVEGIFFDLIEMLLRHKRLWQNLYKTLGHEELERITASKLEELIKLAVNRIEPNFSIPGLDLEIICTFYRKALFGIFIEWMMDRRHDSDEQIRASLERIKVIFSGQVELILMNCRRSCE